MEETPSFMMSAQIALVTEGRMSTLSVRKAHSRSRLGASSSDTTAAPPLLVEEEDDEEEPPPPSLLSSPPPTPTPLSPPYPSSGSKDLEPKLLLLPLLPLLPKSRRSEEQGAAVAVLLPDTSSETPG